MSDLPTPEANVDDSCPQGTHSKTRCANWIFGQCPILCPHEGDMRKSNNAEDAYRLGVTNAIGILRQNEITEKEARSE